ncbi:hypothetical protein J7K44_01230 [bacterium]|nr:hypothetical protein [bacterium]
MKRHFIFIFIFLILNFLFEPIILEKEAVLAQGESVKTPETIEEAKSFSEKILKALPQTIKKLWQEEVLPFWKKTWVKWWHSFIKPWLKNIWQKILSLFEERKPLIKEEFKREKKEMKEEIKKELPKVEKTFWERLKELWE